jgi:hypothetical protein
MTCNLQYCQFGCEETLIILTLQPCTPEPAAFTLNSIPFLRQNLMVLPHMSMAIAQEGETHLLTSVALTGCTTTSARVFTAPLKMTAADLNL